jgi:hypothetical protein
MLKNMFTIFKPIFRYFYYIKSVCHLAGRLVRSLKEQISKAPDSTIKITDKDELCVKIAALCHDLGKCFAVEVGFVVAAAAAA